MNFISTQQKADLKFFNFITYKHPIYLHNLICNKKTDKNYRFRQLIKHFDI